VENCPSALAEGKEFMNRTLLFAAALAAAICVPGRALADDASLFTDDACPQANGPGRKLNALNRQANASSDDMVAAAQGLVDAYHDCMIDYDRDAAGHSIDQSTDYVVVHRAYARLQFARSLQRVASFAAQLHNPASARSNYDAALDVLKQIEGIIGNSHLTATEGSEGRLLAESRSLRDDIVAAVGALPPDPAHT